MATIIIRKGNLVEKKSCFYIWCFQHDSANYILDTYTEFWDAFPCLDRGYNNFDGSFCAKKKLRRDSCQLSRMLFYNRGFYFRSYCRGKIYDEALEEMERYKGTHFDSELVEIFIKML
jgi:hypothetical protein